MCGSAAKDVFQGRAHSACYLDFFYQQITQLKSKTFCLIIPIYYQQKLQCTEYLLFSRSKDLCIKTGRQLSSENIAPTPRVLSCFPSFPALLNQVVLLTKQMPASSGKLPCKGLQHTVPFLLHFIPCKLQRCQFLTIWAFSYRCRAWKAMIVLGSSTVRFLGKETFLYSVSAVPAPRESQSMTSCPTATALK